MERICTPKGFDLYRPLYRYMPLTYFLKLLKTNMLYVAPRKTFKDALESQLDIKLQFGFHAVGNNTQPPDKSRIQEDPNRITEKSKKHREFAELPTSCWTWQKIENILMWECYAQRIGVRIESDANSIAASIDCNGYDCMCADIIYERDSSCNSAEDNLFLKHPSYSDERETRFYFGKIDENNFNISPLAEQGQNQESVKFPVNTKELIKGVTLSPFINRCMVKELIEMLEDKYNIVAKESSILLKD